MSATEENQPRFCAQCGGAIGEGVRFCEACGAAVNSAPTDTSNPPASRVNPSGGNRGRKVMMAMGIVAAVAVLLGIWISGTWTPPPPLEESEPPGSEELFPIEPIGVDSINNTIDGKKVVIEGDGHIMNSPGHGVNRPVWCLVGPTESVFTVPVAKTAREGRGTFAPGFQVLVPVLRDEVENPREVDLKLSLIDLNGEEAVSEHHLKGENRWQPLNVTFPYDSAKAPYQLQFEARGFDGAIYFDRLTPKS